MRVGLGVCVLACSLACIGGCAAGGQPSADAAATQSGDPTVAATALQSGQYDAAFDASREVLRDLNFVLDRVDAQAGVLTTEQKGTGGLATPWDREQTSVGQEFADLLSRNLRQVRIEFIPVGGAGDDSDRRQHTGEFTMTCVVDVYRANTPGWRVDSTAILMSSYTTDPELAKRGMTSYSVAVDRDRELAGRILARILDRMGR